VELSWLVAAALGLALPPPPAHNDVVQKLLRKARKGTRVVYVPGNHDEFARDFFGHAFGGIERTVEATH
jgi:UDP-2,3-diacylglucosamine pyrophosphatase LpxH